MPTSTSTDTYTKAGSARLAETIRVYWADRGHRVTVEPFLVESFRCWGIRSNLVNGLPLPDGRGRHMNHWSGPRKRVLEPRQVEEV